MLVYIKGKLKKGYIQKEEKYYPCNVVMRGKKHSIVFVPDFKKEIKVENWRLKV